MPGGSFWGASKPPSGVPLDPSHALSLGLVFAMVANEGAGKASDSAGAIAPTSTTAWVSGDHGPALSFAGTAVVSYGNILTSVLAGTAPCSIAMRVNPTTIDGTYRRVATKEFFVSGTNQGGNHIICVNQGTGNEFFYERRANATSNAVGTLGVTPVVAGAWYSLVGTYDGANVRMYCNGNLQASSAWTTTVPSTATEPVEIGGSSVSGAFFSGAIDYTYIYNRTLNLTDVQWLASQPYAMFAAPVWRRSFAVRSLPPFRRPYRFFNRAA